jgi:hypothetical protein
MNHYRCLLHWYIICVRNWFISQLKVKQTLLLLDYPFVAFAFVENCFVLMVEIRSRHFCFYGMNGLRMRNNPQSAISRRYRWS